MGRFLVIVIAPFLLCFAWIAVVDASDCGGSSGNLPLVRKPEKGFVPDEATAIRIAEAAWLPIYGKLIYELKPFRGELCGDSLWIVAGTLPKGMDGGVPIAWIAKKDGRIIGVSHEK